MGNQTNFEILALVSMYDLELHITSTQGKYKLYFSTDCTELIKKLNVLRVDHRARGKMLLWYPFCLL